MIYYLAFFFTSATFVIINPYLQVVLDNLGYGFKAVGIFQAFFEGFGILGPLVIGYIANKKGWYKGLTIFALLASSVFFYCLAFVDFLPFVVILLVLTGFFFRAIAPLVDSIANIAVQGDSSKYTKMRATGTMGYVIISALLSFMRKPIVDSNKSIGFWLLVISFVSILIMVFVPKEEKVEVPVRKSKEKADNKWFNNGLIIGLILMGLSRFSMAAIFSFLSLYSIQVVGYTDLTMLNLISALSEFFVMIYSGYLLQNNKIKSLNLIMLGSLAVTVRLFIYAFLPGLKFLLLGQVLHSLCYGAFHVASIHFINQHVRIDKRGVGISLYYALATGLPSVLGSSIGGVVVSSFGFNALFISYGLISLVAVLIGFIFHKPLNKKFENRLEADC